MFHSRLKGLPQPSKEKRKVKGEEENRGRGMLPCVKSEHSYLILKKSDMKRNEVLTRAIKADEPGKYAK